MIILSLWGWEFGTVKGYSFSEEICIMSILQWLDHIDKILLLLIQHDSDQAILDKVMPVLRDAYTWIPLYAFVLYYVWRHAGKKCWGFVALSLLTFAIADSLTTQVLKPLFGRLRPCHDLGLSGVIREVIDCGGLYSMPSTHGANHFGLATCWYFAIREMNGKKLKWLWFWAGAVCYAQVYVGKHYPSDILIGALTGCLTGLGTARLYELWWNRWGGGAFRKFKLMV